MRKGEIACYSKFSFFSRCFPQLYIYSESKCGIVWQWVKCDKTWKMIIYILFFIDNFKSLFFLGRNLEIGIVKCSNKLPKIKEKFEYRMYFFLTHYHTMPHFDTLKIYSCGNIVRKGEIACYKHFSFSHNVFCPIWHLFFLFRYTIKCCLQFVSIWISLKFCRLVMG